MKIYTKQGDSGYTSFLHGERISKDDIRIEVFGELDELNSHIGLLTAELRNTHDIEFINQLQNILFNMSSYMFEDNSSMQAYSQIIENEIDEIQKTLPDIHSFILPGGCVASAQAHICRSVCRRVERHVVCLMNSYQINHDTIPILNRISDYLFVLARKVNFENKIHEKTWQKTCK